MGIQAETYLNLTAKSNDCAVARVLQNPGYFGIGGCGICSVLLPHRYQSLANKMQ